MAMDSDARSGAEARLKNGRDAAERGHDISPSTGTAVRDSAGPRTASTDGFAPTLNPDYPTAWWIVALSADIDRGRVSPLRALERDLVLWREPDGTLHCQAAHCLHLGAHLGHGGIVENSTILCPFHGWGYDGQGRLAVQLGSARSSKGLCLPTYRIMERDGVVYFWNGSGQPDHQIPDYFEHYRVSRDKYFTVPHRLYMPFAAKLFAENICDGMHLAFAHGAADHGSCEPTERSVTSLTLVNQLENLRPWYTWSNVKRLSRRRELLNLATPIRGNLRATSYGGTIQLTSIDNTGSWGNHVVCWTPINKDSHHFFAIDVVPRPRVPAIEPLLRRVLATVLRVGLYSSAVQDFALMKNRVEPANPPYARFDRGLIAFRRFWDSRIENNINLVGDGFRSNGLRAGIRSSKREENMS